MGSETTSTLMEHLPNWAAIIASVGCNSNGLLVTMGGFTTSQISRISICRFVEARHILCILKGWRHNAMLWINVADLNTQPMNSECEVQFDAIMFWAWFSCAYIHERFWANRKFHRKGFIHSSAHWRPVATIATIAIMANTAAKFWNDVKTWSFYECSGIAIFLLGESCVLHYPTLRASWSHLSRKLWKNW